MWHSWQVFNDMPSAMKLFFRLSLLLLLMACNDQYVEPLVFGAVTWPGYDPAYVARELGYLKEEQVHLAEFTNTTEVLRAFRNGQLHVAGLTLDEALSLRSSVPDLQIFLVADFSNGADVLMVRRGINNLGQLRGKRIGVETTALGAYYLSLILREANLSSKDVHIVLLPLDEQVRAFRAGSIDAAVTFASAQEQMAQAGAAVLFDSSRVPGKIVDTLVVRAADVGAQKVHLQEFVGAWFRALGVIRQNRALAYPIMARHEQLSEAQLEATMRGLQLLDRQKNIRQFSGNPSALFSVSQDIQRILKENGLTAGSDDLSLLINPHVIEEIDLD
ncbi:MAG: ABC transporter substrate-binding protein [Nitrosomonadales bacterium]|nr:ABC transporter substrate-binding protein [Nitrosomonadales bacterium]